MVVVVVVLIGGEVPKPVQKTTLENIFRWFVVGVVRCEWR
jgi:hypothetical protein